MRKLTLKGFLADYIEKLSYSGTSSISRLVSELEENPRLREPLILQGILSGMPAQISKKAPEFFSEYEELKFIMENEEKILENKENLPDSYKKIIVTFEYQQNRVQNDNHTKLLMRTQIRQIQYQKNISNYRIYTDLKLNPGNVNSFLKNEDVNKLSLNTVRKMWDFVKEY